MSLILQISDPHFGTERPHVVEALLRLARTQRPDLVVLSGDVTQRGRPSQFQRARLFLDRLGVLQVLVIPGNHDIPLFNLLARCLTPYANHCREFGENLEPSFECDDLLVLGLNTTRWYRHKDGELSRRQIERVASRLASARPGQLRVVVTHQPMAVARDEDRENLLHGHAAALERWAQAGADIVLGGHIHLPYLVPLHEREPGWAKPMWVVQAGTALSRRVRFEAGNSVNLIRVPGEEVRDAAAAEGVGTALRQAVVERWDHHEAVDEFQKISMQAMSF